MQIPFVGQAYQSRSRPQNAQRCINMLLEADQNGGLAPEALYAMPGTSNTRDYRNVAGPVITATYGGRAGYALTDYAVVVVGSSVLKIANLDGSTAGQQQTDVVIGTIGTNQGRVSIASNGLELLIVDGTSAYTHQIGSATIETVTLPFSGPMDADYQDSYFLLRANNTNRCYISELLDGQTWLADQFFTAQGSPDDLVRIISAYREVWAIGSEATEIFVNTEGSGNGGLFPFERSNNVFIQIGCEAGATVCKHTDGLIWLGGAKYGNTQVLRSAGYKMIPISPPWLDEEIASYTYRADAFAFIYMIAGHTLYMLTFPTENKSWCYDIKNGSWRQVAGYGYGLQRYRAGFHMYFKGRHYVGDHDQPCINELGMNYYSDADGESGTSPLVTLRACQPVADKEDGHRTTFAEFELLVEPGTGATWSMRYSDDGGITWSDPLDCSVGAIGEYDKRVTYEALGSGQRRVFEVSSGSDAKRVIMGALVRARDGRS